MLDGFSLLACLFGELGSWYVEICPCGFNAVNAEGT